MFLVSALWLGSLAASTIADVLFLTFLYRVGRFLGVPDIGHRVRRLTIMLVVSSILTLVGVLVPIEHIPGRQAYEPAEVYLTLVIVFNCLVSFVFGFEYRGALATGIAAIAAAPSPR